MFVPVRAQTASARLKQSVEKASEFFREILYIQYIARYRHEQTLEGKKAESSTRLPLVLHARAIPRLASHSAGTYPGKYSPILGAVREDVERIALQNLPMVNETVSRRVPHDFTLEARDKGNIRRGFAWPFPTTDRICQRYKC